MIVVVVVVVVVDLDGDGDVEVDATFDATAALSAEAVAMLSLQRLDVYQRAIEFLAWSTTSSMSSRAAMPIVQIN